MGLGQYIRDTRSELNHVAWPTRAQTIIFTFLVLLVSILISVYLGLFDYVFTTGLGEAVKLVPNTTPEVSPIQLDAINMSTTTLQ